MLLSSSSTPITIKELFLGLLFESAQMCFKNLALPSFCPISIFRFLS